MSSDTTSPSPRRLRARIRRVAVSAVAVVVGAVVLSGCVVIQSESASQVNVIGASVTVSTVLCASNASSAAPCNSTGNSGNYAVTGMNASAGGQLLVGYRIPAGVTAPATITTTVPSQDDNGNPISVTLTLTQSPSYTAGLVALVPPPAGTQWIGYVSDARNYSVNGPQSVTIAPTFGLPAGFVGPFTWRTVVGYRSSFFQAQDVSCPGAFPGTQTSPIPGQGSVCVDYPDLATINGPANSLATGDLSITAPGTTTVSAGSTATLVFAALLSAANPTASVFGATVSTNVPGSTASVTPANFAPAAGAQTNLTVPMTIPPLTAPGTYDVTVTATVAGQSRSATAHVVVTKKAVAASAGKLTLSAKGTTVKLARKTGIALTVTLSRKATASVVAAQTKPKVAVTVRPTLKAGKKTVIRIKSKKFHKGKVTITFKGGGLTRVSTILLK